MTRAVDVLGQLALEGESGERLMVAGRGDTISVELSSLGAGRSLARQAAARSRRERAIGKLQAGLRHTDLMLQVRIAGRPVARLTPYSRPTLLSRMFGLGSMELKPLGLFLAMFRF